MAAYAVSQIKWEEAHGPERYLKLVQNALRSYGGRYLAFGPVIVVEGNNVPHDLAIVEFPSLDAAKRFYESEEYGLARDWCNLRKDGLARFCRRRDYPRINVVGVSTTSRISMLRLPYCYWPAFGLTSDEMDARRRSRGRFAATRETLASRAIAIQHNSILGVFGERMKWRSILRPQQTQRA